jgi:PAS domain-containing protein
MKQTEHPSCERSRTPNDGYSEEEYIGRNIVDFHVDRNVVDELVGRLIVEKPSRIFDLSSVTKRVDPEVTISSSVYFENETFAHSRCFTRDITEQLSAERAMRQLAAIVESTEDAIIGLDLHGTIKSWNQALSGFICTQQEMVGEHVSRLIPPERSNDESQPCHSCMVVTELSTTKRCGSQKMPANRRVANHLNQDSGVVVGRRRLHVTSVIESVDQK